MGEPKRVLHYLNQFFGGMGGEERANLPLKVVEGAVGPGRPLQQALGADGKVVATVICGDNYFNEEKATALAGLQEAFQRFKPDVVVAGPAFNAGRYGVACGEVCKAAQQQGIPAVTAMYQENPGIAEHRLEVYILETGDNPAEMGQIMGRLARFALRLARGEAIGAAYQEGFFPRGVRRHTEAAEPGYRRAVDMLVAKLQGRPFRSELPILVPERVSPAPPLRETTRAVIAMVTTGGLIPRGNPERQTAGNPERFFKYSIEGLKDMEPSDWEAFHGGYYNALASENPNYILPLRPMRILESQGVVGRLHPWIYTMPGVGTPVVKAKRFGAEIAEQLAEAGVDGCILVAT